LVCCGACHGARPQHSPDLHRPGDALQIPWPEVLQLEEIADNPARTVADDNHVRLGSPLQTRCDVWRRANHAALLCVTRSYEVTDHN